MDKATFLVQLQKNIGMLDDGEQKDIIDEYAQHIDMKVSGGMTEAEAIEDFGDFNEFVREVLSAYHVKAPFDQAPFDQAATAETAAAATKSGAHKIGERVSGAFGKAAERVRTRPLRAEGAQQGRAPSGAADEALRGCAGRRRTCRRGRPASIDGRPSRRVRGGLAFLRDAAKTPRSVGVERVCCLLRCVLPDHGPCERVLLRHLRSVSGPGLPHARTDRGGRGRCDDVQRRLVSSGQADRAQALRRKGRGSQGRLGRRGCVAASRCRQAPTGIVRARLSPTRRARRKIVPGSRQRTIGSRGRHSFDGAAEELREREADGVFRMGSPLRLGASRHLGRSLFSATPLRPAHLDTMPLGNKGRCLA